MKTLAFAFLLLLFAPLAVRAQQAAITLDVLRERVGTRAGADVIAAFERHSGWFRSVRVDWRGGLRYPKLERVAGGEDQLSRVFEPLR